MNKIPVWLFILVFIFSCNQKKSHISGEPMGWEILETPVDASLRGLSVLTPDIAWMSGTQGTWMRTLDGGKTWEHGQIDDLKEVDFRSIHGFDAEHAIAVSAGQPAVIYKTSDGGKNWKLTHQEGATAFLDGITFSDQTTGYVFGDPVEGKWVILKTIDQGDSWFAIPNLPTVVEGEAGFAASGSAMIANGDLLILGSGGKESNLHVSKDEGEKWKSYNSPLLQGGGSQGIFAIEALGKGEIVCIGGDYLQEEMTQGNLGIFLTQKEKWETIENPPSGYRSGITYFTQAEWLIAVGPNGTDYSDDGGLNWKKFSEEGFHAVKSGSAEASVWASGGKGKVAKLKF
jgi:photosystem II stability/assembly factor-like uncharacterized protein